MKTLKQLLIPAMILMLVMPAMGQVNYGLRTGLAVSTLSDKGDLCDNSQATLSWTAGAFLGVPVSNSFYIQPELNYIRKGRSNETTELGTLLKTDYSLNYLQIPVLLQYRDNQLIGSEKYIFYINAGPYASLALSDKVDPSGNATVTASKKNDWGATFGIGMETPIAGQQIRFDLRYDMGLSKIANQPEDYRTKCLSLTVGIRL
ncbi:MAG: PorT family protein [Marinilabiliales bacterium]|nr:PorT family protein [Marinilabiliales bacterium]